MIQDIGIDMVEIPRITSIIEKWDLRFLLRVYSEGEIGYCDGKMNSFQHYAARFAVKEAFLKCMGIGIFGGVPMNEIEVVNRPGGKPELKLKGKILKMTEDRGISRIHVSISHTSQHAIAMVVLEK